MNNQQKLKLARKYFIQQKLTEISLFLLIVASIIFVPYLLGSSIGDNMICYSAETQSIFGEEHKITYATAISREDCIYEEYYGTKISSGRTFEKLDTVSIWFEGIFYLIHLFIIGAVLYLLIIPLIKIWLQSNWQKAKKRAGLK